MKSYAILVTGAREWPEDWEPPVLRELMLLPEIDPARSLLIHGACRGVDSLAARVAEDLGMAIREFPYLRELGRAGGPVRNRAMLSYLLNIAGYDEKRVLAFHPDIESSKGTRDMFRQALRQQVAPVKLVAR